jgi:hypothetical protein
MVGENLVLNRGDGLSVPSIFLGETAARQGRRWRPFKKVRKSVFEVQFCAVNVQLPGVMRGGLFSSGLSHWFLK